MNQIRNHLLFPLGSAINTLRDSMEHTSWQGISWRPQSWRETVVIVSVTFTGLWLVKNVCSFTFRFFAGPQAQSSLPDRTPINHSARAQLVVRARDLAAASNPQAHQRDSVSSERPEAAQSLVKLAAVKPGGLTIKNQPLLSHQESDLADALHSYQALKAELDGDENLLSFLATTYARRGSLPEEDLEWQARGVKLENTSQLNETFQALNGKLLKMKLSLDHIQGSDQPLGQADLIDNTSKALFKLSDLYETVRLQAPHILTPEEINLKKKEQKEAQQIRFKTRLEIIEKLFSTAQTVLINEFVANFPKKYVGLFPLFESEPKVLRFVVENIYWFALDIALESFEKKFILTEEKQKKQLQAQLESKLQKFKLDKDKQKQAEELIVKILEKNENKHLISSLAALLLDEKQQDQKLNADQEAVVKPLQDADRKLEEQRIENELSSSKTFQTIYSMFSSFTGLLDRAKGAFRFEEGQQKKRIIMKPLMRQVPPPDKPKKGTFSHEIERVSEAVKVAGEKALVRVGNKHGKSTFGDMKAEMEKIPGISPETLRTLLNDGWTQYPHKEQLMGLSVHQRWLITRVMIIQQLSEDQLSKLWTNVVQSVGERTGSAIKALYSRMIIALLAFEQRTRSAGLEDDKPADQIVEALINPLVESCEALQKVKKNGNLKPGEREAAIAQALGRRMHASAFNNRNADGLFLGKLILTLLSMLQLEELSEEMKVMITKSLTQSGGTFKPKLQKVFEKYNTENITKAKPWIQVGLSFLFDLFQIYVERQSTSSIADQMSDKLNPLNVNAYLIELLVNDKTKVVVSDLNGNKKDTSKWYPDDNEKLEKLLIDYDRLKAQIEVDEEQITKSNNEDLSSSILGSELVSVKRTALECYTRLASLLLRRWVIVNVIPFVPASFTSYVMTLFEDLFELMQYPRILRNIIFHVLENTVTSLALPVDKDQAQVHLNQIMQLRADQPVMDFLLSKNLKANVGAKILKLVKSLSPNENAWTKVGYVTQAMATVIPGYTIFSILQGRVQALFADKFGIEANYWTVGKLISTLDEIILKSATDNDKGLSHLSDAIETQLDKALTVEQPPGQPSSAQPPMNGHSVASSSSQGPVISVVVAANGAKKEP